jgi:hypothetical protein
MMRHASTHRRLFARQTTFIQYIDAYTNDCCRLVLVIFFATADTEGRRSRSLGLRRCLRPQSPGTARRDQVTRTGTCMQGALD